MTKEPEVFIKDISLTRYGFKKAVLFSRQSCFTKDCGQFTIGLVKLNKIDFNVLLYKDDNEEDVIPLKSIYSKKQLEDLLDVLI